MFSRLLTMSLLIMMFSCGGGDMEHSRKVGIEERENSDGTRRTIIRKPLRLTTRPAAAYNDGIYLKVTNLLAQHRPKASVILCSSSKNSNSNTLCYISEEEIDY